MHETQDMGSIPGSERFPGVGNGNLLQYSCLKNSMGRGAQQATVHGVEKSQIRLRVHVHTHTHIHTQPVHTNHGLDPIASQYQYILRIAVSLCHVKSL